MLTGFSFKNYRAFEDGSLTIRPLTILLGANGIGKTSIIQVPLLHKQTVLTPSARSKSALRLNGREVSFGTATNLFRNKQLRRPVEFGFTFENDELFNDLRGRTLSEYTYFVAELTEYLSFILTKYQATANSPSTDKIVTASHNIRNIRDTRKTSGDELLPLLKQQLESVMRVDSKELRSELSHMAYRFFPPSRRRSFAPSPGRSIFEFDFHGLEKIFTFSNRIKEQLSRTFELRFKYRGIGKSDRVYIRELELLSGGQALFSLTFRAQNIVESIRSEFFETISDNFVCEEMNKLVQKDVAVFNLFLTTHPTNSYLADFIRNIFARALSTVKSYFDETSLIHIGPLRAYPKRFYFADSFQATTPEGETLAENLRDNDELRDKVNAWLQRFGLSVTIDQYKETIQKISVRRDELGIDLDIPDVGFGMSQILPVIVWTYLAKAGSTVVVEQPEIHLHPKMQSELADLFIDAIKVGSKRELSKRLVIETHSEYLLNRVRRRIAEGAIQHGDVAIYSVSLNANEKRSEVARIKIGARGSFTWPEEFLSTDLEDTVAFFENTRPEAAE